MFPSIGDDLTCKFSQAVASVTGGSAGCSGSGSEAKGTEDNGGGGDPAVAYPTPTPWRAPPPDPPQVPGVPYGLDPNSDLVKTMQSTERGRQTLQWLRGNDVPVVVDPSKRGAKHVSQAPFRHRRIELGKGYDEAPVLIHEANHARYSIEGRSANAWILGRNDYIDARIAEETDGVVQQIYAAKEFRAAGYSVANQPAEAQYNSAYQNAKAKGASDTEAEQAGYNAVEQAFYNGTLVTSLNSKTYADYYGDDWDKQHLCSLHPLC